VQKEPAMKVIVNAPSIAKGELILVPWGPSVKAAKESTQSIVTTVVNDGEKTIGEFVIDAPLKINCDTIVFWKIRRTSDKDASNMVMSSVVVKVTMPKLDKSIGKTLDVQVPVAVLSKKVNAGNELLLYVPTKQTKKVEMSGVIVMSEPVQKKQKKS